MDWAIFGDCKRDVLVVACKYFVLDLKHHVEKLLINEIAAESFAELALLADTYSCDQLKKVGWLRLCQLVSHIQPLRRASSSSPPTTRPWCSLRNGEI